MRDTRLQTLSGKRVDLTNPTPDQIVWSDVFHSLGLQNRYGGHTTSQFSVGQHIVAIDIYCVNTCKTPTVRKVSFIHDLPEYVLQDIISPLKVLLGDKYEQMTVAWENAFCEKLGAFPGEVFRRVFRDTVQHIDQEAYLAESDIFRPNRPDDVVCNDIEMRKAIMTASRMTRSEVFKYLMETKRKLFDES